MRTGVPNMSLKSLSLYISEWFLLSDNDESWVETPVVLFVWHLLFFSVLGWLAVSRTCTSLFAYALRSSATFTSCYRYCAVLVSLELIVVIVVLAAVHYRHLLLTGRDLQFSSITWFWLSWVGIFGHLYRACYAIRPSLFAYARPAYIPLSTFTDLSWAQHFHDVIDFMIYSAGIATSTSIPGLTSTSLAISAANLTEAAGSLLFIGLVLTTFASKMLESKRNRIKP